VGDCGRRGVRFRRWEVILREGKFAGGVARGGDVLLFIGVEVVEIF